MFFFPSFFFFFKQSLHQIFAAPPTLPEPHCLRHNGEEIGWMRQRWYTRHLHLRDPMIGGSCRRRIAPENWVLLENGLRSHVQCILLCGIDTREHLQNLSAYLSIMQGRHTYPLFEIYKSKWQWIGECMSTGIQSELMYLYCTVEETGAS